MTEFIIIHEIVEANGKTVKENNLERQHNIPVGTLVEVKFDDWFTDGACWKVHARLWVVRHTRDCDGTPLYTLSKWDSWESAEKLGSTYYGFSEGSLTLVEITEAIKRGEGSLAWDEEKST